MAFFEKMIHSLFIIGRFVKHTVPVFPAVQIDRTAEFFGDLDGSLRGEHPVILCAEDEHGAADLAEPLIDVEPAAGIPQQDEAAKVRFGDVPMGKADEGAVLLGKG